MATLRSSSSRLVGRFLLRQRQSSATTIAPAAATNTTTTTTAAAAATFSTALADLDPSQLVSGLTSEQVAANPQIADFLEANFAEQADHAPDGVSIPPEVLKEYGYTEEDFASLAGKPQYGDPRIDRGLGSTTAQQALNIRRLATHVRHAEGGTGTRACDRLRDEANLIPGMIYGSDPTKGISSNDKSTRLLIQTPWPELQRELDRFHRTFESRVYDVTVFADKENDDDDDEEGTVHRVVPRDVQRHPVMGTVYCANFLRYHAGRPLMIPIVYINEEESPALKRDGFIIPVNKFVECIVEEGVPIPEQLELECTGLQLKDVVRIDRLLFPDGVRPSKRVDPEKFVIGPVAGGRGGAEADDEDGEEGASVEA